MILIEPIGRLLEREPRGDALPGHCGIKVRLGWEQALKQSPLDRRAWMRDVANPRGVVCTICDPCRSLVGVFADR